jgi:hypothetical protein
MECVLLFVVASLLFVFLINIRGVLMLLILVGILRGRGAGSIDLPTGRGLLVVTGPAGATSSWFVDATGGSGF